jgi:hypothetical protein
MKTFTSNGRVGKAIFVFALIFGIGLMMSISAQAQGRNDQWQRRERRIWQQQHRDQIHARNDARRAARRDDRYEDNNGRYDRNRGYGNDGGYNNGVYNNDGYNNGNQTALNQGYQAGLQTGASDAQRGQSYNPQRSHYFKDASSQAFRNGFVRGYDAGFRQYGGSNRNDGYRTGNNGTGIGQVLGTILGRP